MEQKEILKKEAAFWDAKAMQEVKRREGRFYSGPANQYREKYFASLVGDIAGKKVLDYGAGEGWYTVDMLKQGANVFAIDISPEAIKAIDIKASALPDGGNYQGAVMDAKHTTFPDDTFDVVVGHGILHHLLDYDVTIREVLRILKPGGKAIFSEPLGMNPFINLYRKLTPKARTESERPLTEEDLNLIKKICPAAKYTFFECASLLAKPFFMLNLFSLACRIEKCLLELDRKILAPRGGGGTVGLPERIAWTVVICLKKK